MGRKPTLDRGLTPEQHKEVQLTRSRAYNKKSYHKQRTAAIETNKRPAEDDLERSVKAAASARTLADTTELSFMELETKQWALLGKLHDAKARLAVVKAHYLLDEVHGNLDVAIQQCTETLRHISSGKHSTELNGAHECSALETEKCCSRVTSIICAWHDQIAKLTAEKAAAAKPSAPPIQPCTPLAPTSPSLPASVSGHEANGCRHCSTASDSDSDSSEDGNGKYESDSEEDSPAIDLDQFTLEMLQEDVKAHLRAAHLNGAEYRRMGRRYEDLLERLESGQETCEVLRVAYRDLIYA
jgi:hypothetical protein